MNINPVIIHMRNIEPITDKMVVEACRQAIGEREDTVFEQANAYQKDDSWTRTRYSRTDRGGRMTREEIERLIHLWHNRHEETAENGQFEEMMDLRDKLVTSILG